MEYYRLALYILFGVLPSLIWLSYYLKKDLHPEPKKMILKIFIYGAIATIPVFLLQWGLSYLLNQLQIFAFFKSFPLAGDILKWFLVIAFVEELLKYLVVKAWVLNNSVLDEPLDIMLYMVVAALGFAALENVLYIFSPIDKLSLNSVLENVIILSFIRFVGATFLHTLSSGLLGYFLALSVLKNSKMKLIIGISLATLLHGFYNFSIIRLQDPTKVIVPVAIIMALAIFMMYGFNKLKKIKSICKI